MATFNRNLIIGFFAAATSLAAVAETAGGECGFAFDLPPGLTLAKDPESRAPVCAYRDSGAQASPFVNAVTVIRWLKIDGLRVNDTPLRDIGFFRLTDPVSIRYLGRPSYADRRNAYAQRVMRSPTRTWPNRAGASVEVVRSELKVNWLKPVDGNMQEEVVETFTCIDAAISNASAVAVVNWCLPKGHPGTQALAKAATSLRLE